MGAEGLRRRALEAREILHGCRLCPRECGVDRTSGEKGFCGCGSEAGVSAFLLHKGEEPPLTGLNGAGTVFFAGCSMSCVFCQNYQISSASSPFSRGFSEEELASAFLSLQDRGAANIDLVTPTPHVPAIIASLALAVERGLRLPIVYNTNSYVTPEALSLLSGVVDVWLPDLKYSSNSAALRLSGVPDYADAAFDAVRTMAKWRPALLLNGDGTAAKGCIVRILLLPDGSDGAEELLERLASEGLFPALSLMGQFSPAHRAQEFPELSGAVSSERVDALLDLASGLGFEDVWFQYADAGGVFVPDFSRENPFDFGICRKNPDSSLN